MLASSPPVQATKAPCAAFARKDTEGLAFAAARIQLEDFRFGFVYPFDFFAIASLMFGPFAVFG